MKASNKAPFLKRFFLLLNLGMRGVVGGHENTPFLKQIQSNPI